MKCDLHLHSTSSDGSFCPEKVVRMAKEKGLKCIALTDHDTLDGVKRAMAEGRRHRLKVLSGIEISTVYQGIEVHILAYNIKLDAEGLEERLRQIRQMRDIRNKALVEKLRQYGMDIDLDAIKSRSNKVIGRPDIANEMVRLGYCQSVKSAFEKYIGKGQCCYVQTERLTPEQAILMALSFGGVPVLAHPRSINLSETKFEEFLQKLVNSGLVGIEAEYFAHTNAERNYYNNLAKKYNLIVTGGSDFHGNQHGMAIGSMCFIPDSATRKVLKI